MRVPFKTETDALRVAIALGVLVVASVLVGSLASRPYGIVVFAAGVAAGVTFELAGRGSERWSPLRDAVASRPDGPTGGKRRVLVVASERLGGAELRNALTTGEGGIELDVLAPVLPARSHYWTSDVDRERQEAQLRLEASVAWATEAGFTARGEVGDADPLTAIEDALRDFGADEVIITVHPTERASWLANRMLAHLQRELDVPVREVAVGEDERP